MWGPQLPTFVCTFEVFTPLEKAISNPMSQPHSPAANDSPFTEYEIRIKGHLDTRWSHWFEGYEIALKDNGETLLSGTVVDQAALHGLLIKVRDLGLPMVSVTPVQSEQTENAN